MPLPRLSLRGQGSTVAIGAMKDQITIQTRAATNAYGQPGGAYSDVVTLWAKKESLAGKENVNNVEFSAEVTDRFTCPYFAGILPQMRVSYTDNAGTVHLFDILFVTNVDERYFFLELLTKEIVSST